MAALFKAQIYLNKNKNKAAAVAFVDAYDSLVSAYCTGSILLSLGASTIVYAAESFADAAGPIVVLSAP